MGGVADAFSVSELHVYKNILSVSDHSCASQQRAQSSAADAPTETVLALPVDYVMWRRRAQSAAADTSYKYDLGRATLLQT